MTSTNGFSDNKPEDAAPEEETGAYFAPLIELPPLVETASHEENEDIVFVSRGKLYTYTKDSHSAEMIWKERCLGDMKILQHKTTNKVRLVMRDQQTLRVRCNHYLLSDYEIKPHVCSENAYVWTGLNDLSDPEEPPQKRQFALRFKKSETADEFKALFEKHKALSGSMSTNTSLVEAPSTSVPATPTSPSQKPAAEAADDSKAQAEIPSSIKVETPKVPDAAAVVSETPATTEEESKSVGKSAEIVVDEKKDSVGTEQVVDALKKLDVNKSGSGDE